MKPSLASKKISRVKARNAMWLNQLATPGLGSLMARQWIAGGGQLVLSGAGFALVMVWFGKMMIQFYGQISGNVEGHPIGRIILAGVILFALAWLWSLWTSFSLLSEASKVRLESDRKSVV